MYVFFIQLANSIGPFKYSFHTKLKIILKSTVKTMHNLCSSSNARHCYVLVGYVATGDRWPTSSGQLPNTSRLNYVSNINHSRLLGVPWHNHIMFGLWLSSLTIPDLVVYLLWCNIFITFAAIEIIWVSVLGWENYFLKNVYFKFENTAYFKILLMLYREDDEIIP